MNHKIFISYRRDDSQKITDEIYKELIAEFGEKNIFRDLNIPAGDDFPDELKKALSACSVMLVIIGNTWLTQVNSSGEPRLKSHDDWVRLEVATGLGRRNIENVKIIPVLVNDAKMPTAEQLRQFELQKLAESMAIVIRNEQLHFAKDIERLMESIRQAISSQIPTQLQKELSQISDQIASNVNHRIDELENGIEQRLMMLQPPSTSIRLVADIRRGYGGYYRWITSDMVNQELFFAGRSVLHRIEDDVMDRSGAQIEEVIIKRLIDGATIRMLFLDPRSTLIERLASDEGQTSEQMLSDIARSISICRRLYDRLQNERRYGRKAHLDIRLYDQIPYFSYHRDNEKVILGFYFSSVRGYDSAAFEAEDAETQRFFGNHFEQIFRDAISLVQLPGAKGYPIFNEPLFTDLSACLFEKLGEEKARKLLHLEAENLS